MLENLTLDDCSDIKYEFVDKLPDASLTAGGTIYVKSDIRGYRSYMLLNGEWVELGMFKANTTISYPTTYYVDNLVYHEEYPKEAPPTNCKNCGAPLKDGKCEYCGSEY